MTFIPRGTKASYDNSNECNNRLDAKTAAIVLRDLLESHCLTSFGFAPVLLLLCVNHPMSDILDYQRHFRTCSCKRRIMCGTYLPCTSHLSRASLRGMQHTILTRRPRRRDIC